MNEDVDPAGARPDGRQIAIAAWGVLGVTALLTQAVVRLGAHALVALGSDLDGVQLTVLVAWVLVSAYSEGYRGFQRQFCPRVVARAFHLGRAGTAAQIALAPAFCMSFFHASRRGLMRAWILLTGIVVLVLLVRQAPQPWRGIIDAGVVLGLGWGIVVLLLRFVEAARRGAPPPSDLPAPLATE